MAKSDLHLLCKISRFTYLYNLDSSFCCYTLLWCKCSHHYHPQQPKCQQHSPGNSPGHQTFKRFFWLWRLKTESQDCQTPCNLLLEVQTHLHPIWLCRSDGVRIGSGPEKSGLSMKMEVRVMEIKIRTQTGPKMAFSCYKTIWEAFNSTPLLG